MHKQKRALNGALFYGGNSLRLYAGDRDCRLSPQCFAFVLTRPVQNQRLSRLPEHTWDRLRALLDGHAPGAAEPINLALGEPQHQMPAFVGKVLSDHANLYAKYPPLQGSAEWQAAVESWLKRRYGLSDIAAERHILPLSGTREGLFSAALVAVPESKADTTPAVMIPNPFYQCYAAAALSAGAEPVYVPAMADNGFLPDFMGLDESQWERTAAIYLCTPSNPQGTVASRDYLAALITRARRHDVTLLVDECYSEIYVDNPPPGVLEVCAAMAEESGDDVTSPYANVLSFQSLSKRSNLPGLRSGFIAGDPALIETYRTLRAYGGCPSPLPVYAAAAAAWNDEEHVEVSRALYREKIDAAERIFAGRYGFFRPAGGFFLWLDVGDGEVAAERLWREAGIRVVPGRYLAQTDEGGYNPGTAYIRVALVQPSEITERALKLLVQTLDASFGGPA